MSRPKCGPYSVYRHVVTQPTDPSYRLIALTQGQNALVDTSDFEFLNKFNWIAHWCADTHSFYADREEALSGRLSRKTIKMHRLILSCSPSEEGDHKNGDTLDNRRQNLRKCTKTQNRRNRRKHTIGRSHFKGIRWHAPNGTWQARIENNGSRISLGYFPSPEDAAHAYDEAAKILYGEFAHLNFP